MSAWKIILTGDADDGGGGGGGAAVEDAAEEGGGSVGVKTEEKAENTGAADGGSGGDDDEGGGGSPQKSLKELLNVNELGDQLRDRTRELLAEAGPVAAPPDSPLQLDSQPPQLCSRP